MDKETSKSFIVTNCTTLKYNIPIDNTEGFSGGLITDENYNPVGIMVGGGKEYSVFSAFDKVFNILKTQLTY